MLCQKHSNFQHNSIQLEYYFITCIQNFATVLKNSRKVKHKDLCYQERKPISCCVRQAFILKLDCPKEPTNCSKLFVHIIVILQMKGKFFLIYGTNKSTVQHERHTTTLYDCLKTTERSHSTEKTILWRSVTVQSGGGQRLPI